MRITIHPGDPSERSINTARGPIVIREQSATVETTEFRQRIRVGVPRGAAPFPAGDYALDLERAFTVGKYGDLQLVRDLPLLQLAKTTKAA